MSAFDEVLGTKIEVRRRTLGRTIDKDFTDDATLETDLFPEFSKLLEDVPGDDDSEGCPLPGTPEDESLIDAKEEEELRHRVVNRESHDDDLVLSSMAQSAFETAEELVHKVWEEVASWKTQPFSKLPKWLQDNDYLHHWHRPPLPSFAACFKSIFRIHTETGNIWTHLLGCISFIGVMVYFLTGSSLGQHWVQVDLKEKLDYCGIALLIMGSFVPWLYYGFYCDFQPKLIYLTAVVLLGITTIVVSLWEKFSTPTFRPLRAAVFLTFGLSGIIPAVHYTLIEGFDYAITRASMGWLILMGALYVIGALLYAVRVPERFFPGKCDLWFQSHQIFHILVIAAAFVHYHGISEMAMYRLTHGDCTAEDLAVMENQDLL
nr:adiponectin receptor protein-like isoform X2 [Procambarus clarkii]